ncbi:PP2C family protein-serine/threonine phosphatase [Streptomyces sp. NPDC054861]
MNHGTTRHDQPGLRSPAVALESYMAVLEDSAEELYDTAPCGYVSILLDGTVARVNTTLLQWLGIDRGSVVGRVEFGELLTPAGRLSYEAQLAPALRLNGEVGGVPLELACAGEPLPVLASAIVRSSPDGRPLLARITLTDARDRRAYEAELLHNRKEAEAARRTAEADRARLQDALAVLQRSLLPARLPSVPGLDAASYYHTASPDRLGGDFYDLFPLDGKRWAFFLGDVCGKGPEAAALTSLTRYTLRAAALHDPDPVAALRTLNTALTEHYPAGETCYCTAVFGVLEPAGDDGSYALELASGGHPPSLVLRGDGRTEFLSTPGGLLVGILPDARFVAARTTLHPGDSVLLYTDGLTEARTGAARDLFGDEALRDFVASRAPATPAGIVTALTGLLEGFGDGLGDDTALLALGVPADASSGDRYARDPTPDRPAPPALPSTHRD